MGRSEPNGWLWCGREKPGRTRQYCGSLHPGGRPGLARSRPTSSSRSTWPGALSRSGSRYEFACHSSTSSPAETYSRASSRHRRRRHRRPRRRRRQRARQRARHHHHRGWPPPVAVYHAPHRGLTLRHHHAIHCLRRPVAAAAPPPLPARRLPRCSAMGGGRHRWRRRRLPRCRARRRRTSCKRYCGATSAAASLS